MSLKITQYVWNMKKKTVKEVKIHKFLVYACKSQDFAQSQKKIARSHNLESVTFRNSGYALWKRRKNMPIIFLMLPWSALQGYFISVSVERYFHSARPLGRSESWCWTVCMSVCVCVCVSVPFPYIFSW